MISGDPCKKGADYQLTTGGPWMPRKVRPLNMVLQRCPVLRSGVLVLVEWLMTPGQVRASPETR